ncbi:MFS transporter [Streptomyces sp. NPDC087440]|uniref:MFS transporter n=1 Tax=Streptomyces sp. NPDC087440 TaxID=3365790 RepID=UPI00381A3D56
MKTSPDVLRTARRRYVTVNLLFWLPTGLSFGTAVLLFTERGLSLAAVAACFAAHSITAAVLELPTGGLSDVLGRRPILALAGVFNVAALLLQSVVSSPAMLALSMALVGAGRALSSGPAEAWYVDTVQAHSGPDADLRTGLARGSTAVAVALAVGTLTGGAIPWLLSLGPDLGAQLAEATGGLLVPMSVPRLLGAAVAVGFVLYVLSALREPPREPSTLGQVVRGVPATVLQGLKLGTHEATVRRVLLGSAAAGAGLAAMELLVPGRAAGVTGSLESGAVLYSVLSCAGFVLSGFGSSLAPLVARLTRSGERAVLVSFALGVCGLVLLAVTARSTVPVALGLAVLGFGIFYLGLGAAGPNENELLHRRVTSAQRATALSVQSLALQISAGLSGVVMGAMAAGAGPWLLAAGVLMLGTLLWVRAAVGGGTVQPPPAEHTEEADAVAAARG